MRPAIALVLVCACGAPDEGPAMPPTPVTLPCSLSAELGVAHGIRMTLERTLDDAAAAGPHAVGALFAEAPGTLTDVLGLATRRDPVEVVTIVTCPDAPFLLGHGLVTDLVVGLTTAIDPDDPADADELRSVILRGAYADWSDGWRIHVTPPRDAFAGMRVRRTEAEVWASLARRWVTVDVTLDAEVDDGTLVLIAPPLEAPVTDRDAPLHAGFRLVEAESDGERADVVLGTGGYLVIGGLARGAHRIHLRYEGPLPLVGDNQAEASVLELMRWLPTVPGADPAPLALTLHHPIEDALIASLPEVARATEERDATGTWRVAHLGGEVDRDPALLLVESAPSSRTWDDGRGSRIELIGTALPSLEECAPALDTIVRALAPLGPVGDVRVVAVSSVYGRHGQRADDLIVLLRDKLVDLCLTGDGPRRDLAIALLAHELAHGWFGRQVRALDDEASSWWEAQAEYVSSWALDDGAAARLRRRWRDDYAEQAHRDLFAMAQRVPTSGKLHDALSYDKGALLLTALEDRVGREHLASILRHQVTSRAGQLGSWLDLVVATQAIAGSQAAAWLHGWLYAVGAPELKLADLEVADGRLRVTVVVDAEGCDAPVDLVDLAVFRGDRLLGQTSAPLSGDRTALELALPAGADRIVLDPWSRLPRFGGTVELDLPAAPRSSAR